jgi:tetratricopeptide (TPR) repeat protein
MSVTSFLSTSKDKSVAMAFAIPYLEVTNDVAVLFEIEVDHEDMETAFGDIQKKSQMPGEEEILFTMGSRFQIQSINLNDRNVWEVKLKLTGKEDEQLRKLAEYMKKDYTYPNPLVKMARLMLEMGKYMQAEQFYRLLLEDDSIITNFNNYSATLNNLGAIYSIVGNKEKAIDCFEKSLDVKLQHLNPQHFLMAYNYNNLANIYHKEGDREKALSYHNKALECDLNAPFSNESCIASDYSNIASVYQDQGRYSEALTIFEKCFQIHSKIFPKNHPLISTSYHHIAQIYHIQKDYDRAIEYLTKALDIQLVSLPSNHPMLGSTYKSLALVLYDQGKLKEALTYMMMAYENHRISFSFDHSLPMEEWKWINNIKIELGENDLQNPSWTEKINN